MPPENERLEKLIQQQNALKLAINREKKKLSEIKRKEDTRRKILLGATVQSVMQKEPELRERVLALLEDRLVRDDDRALFGLAPKQQEPPRQKAS